MKTIVITGASDGIGAEMARQLAQRHGAQLALVLAARNEDGAARRSPRSAGPAARARWWSAPMSPNQPQCRALIAGSHGRFGRIDALINNAGMSAQALFEDVRARRPAAGTNT